MHDGDAPPVYTPRAEDDGQPPVPGPSVASPERPITRQVGYDTGPAPDDREVSSYEYLPRKKQVRQIQNKGSFFSLEGHLIPALILLCFVTEDRMLLLFWIPILLSELKLTSYVALFVSMLMVFAL